MQRYFEMDEKLRQLLSDVFGVGGKEITESSTANDIDTWDSIKHLQLVIALEQSYGVELDTDEISNLRSVKDIVECLRSHGAA